MKGSKEGLIMNYSNKEVFKKYQTGIRNVKKRIYGQLIEAIRDNESNETIEILGALGGFSVQEILIAHKRAEEDICGLNLKEF